MKRPWIEMPLNPQGAQVNPYCMHQGRWVRIIDQPGPWMAVAVPAAHPKWGIFCYRVYQTLKAHVWLFYRVLAIWGLASIPQGARPHWTHINVVRRALQVLALLR